MKLFRSAHAAGRWAPSSVALIGKFDGLHAGHQKIIQMAVARAKALATRCLLVTFDPSPDEFVHHGFRPLVPLERRLELMAGLGIDAAVLLPFDARLSCQAPEAFARDVLVRALRVVDVFAGSDFCFGKDRSGDVRTLACLGKEMGFLVHEVPLVRWKGRKVTEAVIRRLLEEGCRADAEHLLGRRTRGQVAYDV